MNAKGLMIGDWVQIDGKPFRITAISDNNCINNLLDADEWNILPITLTSKILTKNGFRSQGLALHRLLDIPSYILFEQDKTVILQKSYDEAGYWFCHGEMLVIKFNYVHELQHLLRLLHIEKEIIL